MNLIERLRIHMKDYGAAVEAADRIEQLEAALRAVIVRCEEGDKNFNWLSTIANIARAALDQSSPPKGNAAGWHIEPKRQENDDVFKGFRGNNEA